MEEFRRLKFAFNYFDRERKITEPEQFWWAVKCFKKFHKITGNTQEVKDFLKQFSVKSLHLGMQYCRCVDHDFTCECNYCFLFDNAKLILLGRNKLAFCFVADVCDITTNLSYRSVCDKSCSMSKFYGFSNIDKWAADHSGPTLDYLKIFAVFDSIIH